MSDPGARSPATEPSPASWQTILILNPAARRPKLWFDWDWPGAEREYRRALELNSNLAKAHTVYAAYLATIGRVQEAINEAERAHQLDPVSLSSLDSEASVFIYSRRYAEAVELCRRKIELEPDADRAYAWLAVTQTLLGHHT